MFNIPGTSGANSSQQSQSGRTPPPELRTQRNRQQSTDQSRERRIRRQRAQTVQQLPPVDSSATHLVPPIPGVFGRHDSLEMIDLGEENNNNVSRGREGARIL